MEAARLAERSEICLRRGGIDLDSGVLGRASIYDGRWHHVTGVYDGRRDVSATVAGFIAANSLNVRIGWDSYRTEWAWNGRIDDVHIYSYALSEDEIRNLYEGKEPPMDER